MSDALWPHGLKHVKHPCPSQSPRVCSNSCPLNGDAIQPSCWCHQLSWWCHPTSVIPFSPSCQSFSASGSFLMNQLYASGGQSTGASTSASVLLMNIQDWFPLGWTGLISLQSKELSSLLQNHSRIPGLSKDFSLFAMWFPEDRSEVFITQAVLAPLWC